MHAAPSALTQPKCRRQLSHGNAASPRACVSQRIPLRLIQSHRNRVMKIMISGEKKNANVLAGRASRGSPIMSCSMVA